MFSATTPYGKVQWDNEQFTGDPVMVALVRAQISSGDPTPTFDNGPFIQPNEANETDAWYAARYVLGLFFGGSVDWSEPPAADPRFAIPPTALG